MKKPRGQYHHGDLRAAALEAAERELDHSGHEQFTVARVARRLGVSPGALYRHFQNRDELLRDALGRVLADWLALADREIGAAKRPRDRLLALTQNYVSFAIEHPGWFRLQFSRPGVALDVKYDEAAVGYPAMILDAIAAFFPAAGAKEREDWYLAFWALAHGLASLTLERVFPHVQDEAQRQRVARDVCETVIVSLETRTKRTARKPARR